MIKISNTALVFIGYATWFFCIVNFCMTSAMLWNSPRGGSSDSKNSCLSLSADNQ